MLVRRRLILLALPLVAGALFAIPRGAAQPAPAAAERWIIEPGPEAPDAQKQGAPEIERAQKLAKAKQYADAAQVLETLDRRLPAAVHDCNLALAYLRAGALSRAQLVWDLSGLRNGPRPKWCTGDVSTQLSNALRAAGFVPTTIDVEPSNAVIEVGGVLMRSMRTVWLPPGQATISASAPGRVSQTVTTQVTSPSTRVALTLPEPPPVEPDAGVTVPAASPDAQVATSTVVADAAPADAADATPVTSGASTTVRYVALSAAIVGWIGAGVFGALTVKAKDDASSLYATDPAFSSKKSTFTRDAWLTTGSISLGVIATALTVWLFVRDDSAPAKDHVQVGLGPGGVGITYSGSFGGSW